MNWSGSGSNSAHTYKIGGSVAYVLIPKYHGPDCALKRCPVSNNNRWSRWLECNGEGKCDHTTGRCKCNSRFYLPDCSRIKCPVSKRGLVCDGKGWCDSVTGLCHCNYNPSLSLSQRFIRNPNNPWTHVTADGSGSFRKYLTGTRGNYGQSSNYALIPKYHGPDCALKRCPVSNNNRYNTWLECNGEGTCDSNTGRCTCNPRFYAPNCAKIRCPVSKRGKICDCLLYTSPSPRDS